MPEPSPEPRPAAPPAGGTAPMDGPPPAPAAEPSAEPAFAAPGLGAQWRALGGPPCGLPEGARYRVGAMLGMGATARVWEAEDRNLERIVAVKVLAGAAAPEGVQHFLGEARLMALLDHPNVLPVHEAAFTSSGEPYFAMKRIAGSTLGDALAAASQGRPSPRLAASGAVVAILIDVAKAVSYAHHRGVVHQDIKPDNILLGDYGEVLLLDWGSALRRQPDGHWQGGIYGTPLYMAPEQARRERVGPAADVYALGATLFHALLGRVPCWSDDPDAFWRMRSRGEIQAPTAAERARVPAPLLSIALTALAPRPQDRYASADAFLKDLQSYQAGLAVSAHRDTLWRFLGRWCRAHRQWLAAAGLVLCALALAASAYYRAWAREQASWREAMAEDFRRPLAGIAADWRLRRCPMYPDGQPLEDAALEQGSDWHPGRIGLAFASDIDIADIACRRDFPGDLRVEWDEVSPGSGRGLNCFLGSDRQHGYTFHVGGWGDSTLVVLTQGRELARLNWAHIAALQRARTYHLAMERVDRSIRLEIDGRRVIDYQGIGGMDAPDRPTFGFEGVLDKLEISHVRVYTRRPPQLVSPLAVPDALFRAGDWQQAYDGYQALCSAYPGTALAQRARFGSGLALAREGRLADADAVLRGFIASDPGHEDVPFAMWERLRLACQRHDHGQEERLREDLARFRGNGVLSAVINDLSEDRCALLAMRPVAAVGDQLFPPERIPQVEAACAELDRWSRAYGVSWANTRFGAEAYDWLQQAGCDRFLASQLEQDDSASARDIWSRARETLGEQRAMLVDPRLPDFWRWRVRTDLMDGSAADGSSQAADLAKALAGEAAHERLRAKLVKEGRASVAQAIAKARAAALAWSARMIDEGALPMVIGHGLVQAGRDDEVLARFPTQLDDVAVVAMERMESGRQQDGEALLRALGRMSWYIRREEQDPQQAFGICLAHDLAPAFLDLDAGRAPDLAAIEAAVRDRCERQLWYVLALARGDIDEAAFRAQPLQLRLEEHLSLAKAVRAEWAHEPAQAVAAYRQVLDATWETDVPAHLAHWRRFRFQDRD